MPWWNHTPINYRQGPTVKKPTPRESVIQRNILAMLKDLGIPAWRINSRVVDLPTARGPVPYRMGGVKGMSDILACLPGEPGRFMALEVKRPGGKLTPEQDEFLRRIIRAGGIGACVTSCHEVSELLARHGWAR